MEGQNQLVKLAPCFRPEPVSSGGFHTRRLTRHGFLSNRWGLQRHRTFQTSSLFTKKSPEMFPRRAGSHSVPPRGLLKAGVMPTHEVQSALDHNFGVLRLGFHGVGESLQRLEKTTENISKQFTEGFDRFFEQHTGPAIVERMEKTHNAEKKRLKSEHRTEIERLQRERALVKTRLEEKERDLGVANLQLQMAAKDLADAQRMMNSQAKQTSQIKKLKDPDEYIKASFLSLRESILEFSRSPAIQLGPLPDTLEVADNVFHPQTWNRASPQQRKHRVMAKVFHLLFRRILRPSLRIFGVQAFLRSDEHHSISSSEAHLRGLEKDLEAQGVQKETLNTWIATTIDTITPLRDIPQNVGGITQEILEALAPVMMLFAFNRNADRVKSQISAICEEAVRLKLAMRRAHGNYKIEVPSRDAKRWGEPGCDQETRALVPAVWLRVIDREAGPGTEEEREAAAGKQTRSDIACIIFGALTKLEEGNSSGKNKIVLEKGCVVSKAETGRLKRKAAVEEEPRKRVNPNRGVSPAHLARIKALMGEAE
ncbi:hypothetical protein C8A00DRAFT_17763 [Chaetomidium leptoderma]|uniref:Uncharacterized protein n=1 Tax=Chaetomidium leptoderma TaxID=669021 RepID=A0AAN6VG08_9PEZI|nr:hypothetical protein C8A00DRAFT_17763 [Chaetomidium leptoderma]